VIAVGLLALASGGSRKPALQAKLPPPKLTATVGAPGQVTLTASDGQPVTRLRSGWYTILVSVNASNSTFRLSGPAVKRTTRRSGSVSIWAVHFVKGTYRYTDDRGGDALAATHVISVY
jgi:hypothetical protein